MEMAYKALYSEDNGPVKRGSSSDPTEIRREWQARGEWIFDSATKTMSTGWYSINTKTSLVTVKGAPECILPRCIGINQEKHDALLATISRFAKQGLRVLALAKRTDIDLSDAEASIGDLERTEVEQQVGHGWRQTKAKRRILWMEGLPRPHLMPLRSFISLD